MTARLGRALLLLIAFFLFLGWGALLIYGAIGPGYIYENTVHSHMENAYYAADPTTMKNELLLAVDGMKTLGLTKDKYGAFLPWNKVPKHSMEWQYKHMDSLIIRCDEFINWERSLNTTSTAQVKDVYTEKLDNMRRFLQEDGWSDDIAENAFWLNNFLWLVILTWATGVMGGILMLFFWVTE